MSSRDVFVISAARTAIGTFGGTLKDAPLADPGHHRRESRP